MSRFSFIGSPQDRGLTRNGSCLSCGRPARRRKGVGRLSVPRQGHNTPFPLKRSPPASFKRLLGRAARREGGNHKGKVLPIS